MTLDSQVTHWMLVAKDIKHLATLRESDRSWWCVPAQCTQGDRAFVYKPGVGIVLYLQISVKAPNRDFCEQFHLNTAHIQVMRIFDPALPIKSLRTGAKLKMETFLTRQFQGSSFKFLSNDSVSEILTLPNNPV